MLCSTPLIFAIFSFIGITTRIISASPVINGVAVGSIKSNGKVINSGEFPFLTLLEVHVTNAGKTETGYCGGTLIKQNLVLTVAHCLPCGDRVDITVSAGFVHTEREPDVIQKLKAIRYHVHEDFNYDVTSSTYLHNDIALVWLEKSFVLGKYVALGKLSSKQLKFSQKTAVIAGWGHTTARVDSTMSKMLNKVKLYVMLEQNCKCFYSTTIFGDKQFCAKAKDGKSGVGRGDSGGPLIFNGYVVGLLSLIGETMQNVDGQRVLLPETYVPAVFLNVFTYYNWIQNAQNVVVPGCSRRSSSSSSSKPSRVTTDQKSKSCTIL